MTRRHGALSVPATALTALILAGCVAAPASVEIIREPFPSASEVPEVDAEGMLLPFALADLRIIDPAWILPAQGRDGVLLSASDRGGFLEYTAIDSDGTALWAAQRPTSCTGFVVTVDADGRALAVLTDSLSTADSLASTTASAFDLRTGDAVWGPVPVPGPARGVGLVFASTPPGALGSVGPATVLDPSTGSVVLEEREQGDGRRVLGELHGTMLLADGDQLVAVSTATGDELWRAGAGDLDLELAELSVEVNRTRSDLADHLVLLETGDASSARHLLDLQTGTLIARGVGDAISDALSGVTVVLDGAALTAHDAERRVLWTESTASDTALGTAGNGMLYLRQAQAVVVRNAVTGAIAVGYDPDASGTIVLPRHFTERGAAIVEVGQRELMVTTTPER